MEPTSPYVVAKFYVEDESEPTNIFGLGSYGSTPELYFTHIWIDGEEVESTEPYANLTNGEHTVEYELSDNTIIDKYAFEATMRMTSITFPKTVEKINERAFFLSGIKAIIIPDNIKYLISEPFAACANLTTAVMGDGLLTIDNFTFGGCENLSSVTIGQSITEIGQGAFEQCFNLNTIIIKSVTPPLVDVSYWGLGENPIIYVPSESVNAYKTAEGWSELADIIQPIP